MLVVGKLILEDNLESAFWDILEENTWIKQNYNLQLG